MLTFLLKRSSGTYLSALAAATPLKLMTEMHLTSHWCHNERHGAPNHRQREGLFNRSLQLTWKETAKPALLPFCEGNLPVTGGFSSRRASDPESVSIPWSHHGSTIFIMTVPFSHKFSRRNRPFHIVLRQTGSPERRPGPWFSMKMPSYQYW